MKGAAGFAQKRTVPEVVKVRFHKWLQNFKATPSDNKVYIFCDEFTNFNDAEIGKKAVKLLDKLGFEVIYQVHEDCGRPQLSKGLLDEAKKQAEANVELFSELITGDKPLIGIEPSAILTFRDEYISLLRGETQEKAKALSKNVFTIEEFLAKALDNGDIIAEQFSTEEKPLKCMGTAIRNH